MLFELGAARGYFITVHLRLIQYNYIFFWSYEIIFILLYKTKILIEYKIRIFHYMDNITFEI